MNKYTTYRFASTEDMERFIMADSSLNDYEKLVMIFKLNEETVRKCNVQLYYALLAVADKLKNHIPIIVNDNNVHMYIGRS